MKYKMHMLGTTEMNGNEGNNGKPLKRDDMYTETQKDKEVAIQRTSLWGQGTTGCKARKIWL